MKNGSVKGPGTFLSTLINELASLTAEDMRKIAKIRIA
jgi:hydroxyethylthiazole kinase-like sugar kinase family protein